MLPALEIGMDVVGYIPNPVTKTLSTAWGVGRTLDELTGASDKASDYAAYGTTKPWAGTVEQGRNNMRAYKKRSKKIRAKVLERHRAEQRRAEQREEARTPRAASEAPRLDKEGTRVDRAGRVYVNDELRGQYVNGRFIPVAEQ